MNKENPKQFPQKIYMLIMKQMKLALTKNLKVKLFMLQVLLMK